MTDIVPLKDASDALGRSFLIYGPPGSGKTTLASMHPGKRKLWLDMDQKLHEMTSLQHRDSIDLWTPREPLGNPDRIEIPWSPDPKNVGAGTIPAKKPMGYEKLVGQTNDLLKQAHSGQFPYDLAVLDTLTAVGDHWTRLLMYTHRVSFMTERLWGIYLAGMMEYVSGFLNLPCDRIVIAHEKRRTDEDTKQETIRPSVAGQLGDNLVRFFSEGWYLKGRDRSGKYQLQTISADGIAARTSGSLEPIVLATPDVFKR